jgi:phage head maturation protease
VTWPAYEETEVAARSHQAFKEQRSMKSATTPFRLLRLRQARLKINN